MEGWILPRAWTSTLLKQCGKAANIQRRALGCCLRSLENYSWRLLKEMTRKVSERVHTVLKNKGAQTKYWLSSLLELYKLCSGLTNCIAIRMPTMKWTTAPFSCCPGDIQRNEGWLRTWTSSAQTQTLVWYFKQWECISRGESLAVKCTCEQQLWPNCLQKKIRCWCMKSACVLHHCVGAAQRRNNHQVWDFSWVHFFLKSLPITDLFKEKKKE